MIVPRNIYSDRVGTDDISFEGDPGLTKQSMKDECDVNIILKKFAKTGLLSHAREHQGQYGDFSNVTDYRSALEQVQMAEGAFLSLPAEVREKFDNDAAAFLDFTGNPANREKMIEMGLIIPADKPETAPIPANSTEKETEKK